MQRHLRFGRPTLRLRARLRAWRAHPVESWAWLLIGLTVAALFATDIVYLSLQDYVLKHPDRARWMPNWQSPTYIYLLGVITVYTLFRPRGKSFLVLVYAALGLFLALNQLWYVVTIGQIVRGE